jgi:magnesium-transporting ATPase (P-type)
MEKYAEKAKITFPSLGKGFPMHKWKKLMIFATIIYLISFFTPWIWMQYYFIIIELQLHPEIYPPSFPREGWFWSFMAVIRTTWNEGKVLVFHSYWFNRQEPYYQGWFGVFIFQILTLTMALITILRKTGDKKLSAAATALLSALPPILCVYQHSLQSTPHVGTSQFFVGFWLSLISSLMFFVSFGLLREKQLLANG